MKCPNCAGELKLETRIVRHKQQTFEVCASCGFSTGKNHLRVEEMWAWVSVDPVDQNEGIIAFDSSIGPMPMVGADKERMMSLRSIAQQTVKNSGIEVRLLRFTVREEIETLSPQSG